MKMWNHSGNKLLNSEYKNYIMPENFKLSQKLVSSLTKHFMLTQVVNVHN